jgi:hypothetical protein
MSTLQIKLSFSQILNLVKALPVKDKEKLSKALEKEQLESTLDYEKWRKSQKKPNYYPTMDEIVREVKIVRAEKYANEHS